METDDKTRGGWGKVKQLQEFGEARQAVFQLFAHARATGLAPYQASTSQTFQLDKNFKEECEALRVIHTMCPLCLVFPEEPYRDFPLSLRRGRMEE